MARIQGRTAFVTGAASGIGRAAAIALAREGANVMLTDIDAPGGRETAAMIEASGGIAQFRGQDVTEEDRWAELITRTMTLFGRLDILVNNAGIGIGVPITEMTLEQWNRQLAINMTGVFLGVKHAIPAMRTEKPEGSYRGGSIINISSVAGLVGSPGLTAYCATKGGVRLFSKAVAMECAAAGDGIRVNSVHPGIIDTPIWARSTPAAFCRPWHLKAPMCHQPMPSPLPARRLDLPGGPPTSPMASSSSPAMNRAT